MKTDKFSDRVDVNTVISLYDYGLIRNPKTDKTIVCINSGEEHTKKNPPKIKVTWIDLETVKEHLEDISEGFFDFIGSDRQTEIDALDYCSLTHIISSLDSYNGEILGHLRYGCQGGRY